MNWGRNEVSGFSLFNPRTYEKNQQLFFYFTLSSNLLDTWMLRSNWSLRIRKFSSEAEFDILSSKKPKKYWEKPSNRRKFFNTFAKQNGFTKYEDWYKVYMLFCRKLNNITILLKILSFVI